MNHLNQCTGASGIKHSESSLFCLFHKYLVSKMKETELPSMRCVSSSSTAVSGMCSLEFWAALSLLWLLQLGFTKQWNNCHYSVSECAWMSLWPLCGVFGVFRADAERWEVDYITFSGSLRKKWALSDCKSWLVFTDSSIIALVSCSGRST